MLSSQGTAIDAAIDLAALFLMMKNKPIEWYLFYLMGKIIRKREPSMLPNRANALGIKIFTLALDLKKALLFPLNAMELLNATRKMKTMKLSLQNEMQQFWNPLPRLRMLLI